MVEEEIFNAMTSAWNKASPPDPLCAASFAESWATQSETVANEILDLLHPILEDLTIAQTTQEATIVDVHAAVGRKCIC